jgi:hypothetical protein
MKQQGRVFECEPCREIIIFFAVSDASPYIALAAVDRVTNETRPAYPSNQVLIDGCHAAALWGGSSIGLSVPIFKGSSDDP